jgi:hypothetical protein
MSQLEGMGTREVTLILNAAVSPVPLEEVEVALGQLAAERKLMLVVQLPEGEWAETAPSVTSRGYLWGTLREAGAVVMLLEQAQVQAGPLS